MQPNLLLSPACLLGSMAVLSLAALVSGLGYSDTLSGASLNVIMSYTILLLLVSLVANLTVMTSYLNDFDFGEAIYLVVSGVQLVGWLAQTIIWTKCETARAVVSSTHRTSFCPGSPLHYKHNDGYIALLLFGYLLILITAAYIVRIVVLRFQVIPAEDLSFTPATQIYSITNSQINGLEQLPEVHPNTLQPPPIPTINIEVWNADEYELNAIEALNIPKNPDLVAQQSNSYCGPDSYYANYNTINTPSHAVFSDRMNGEHSTAMEASEQHFNTDKDNLSMALGAEVEEHIPGTTGTPYKIARSSSVYSQPCKLSELEEVDEVDLPAWEKTNPMFNLERENQYNTTRLLNEANNEIVQGNGGDSSNNKLEDYHDGTLSVCYEEPYYE